MVSPPRAPWKVTASDTLMVSLMVGIVTVACGSAPPPRVLPEPLKGRTCWKLVPDGVLVRLLKPELSVKMMRSFGAGPIGAVNATVKVQMPPAGSALGNELLASEQETCVIAKAALKPY